jgi:CubicO group peptidase (beta-lactamase class C family)
MKTLCFFTTIGDLGRRAMAPARQRKWRTHTRSVCVAFLALAAPLSVVAQSVFSEAEGDAIQAFLRRTFTNDNSGMVIGILDARGSKVFSAGKLGNGTDQEVSGDTVFEIGSVTKVFTSLLALDMARRGEVKLDDPVAKYLPERVKVPAYDGKEITLRNLATQDSGLPWNPDDLDKILSRDPKKPSLKEFKAACDAYTAEDLYAFLDRHKLTNAPGNKFQYSNVGMSLLGHAMALRAGESYESLVVNRIARPLKMDSTRITLTPEQKTRLARGHWADGTPSENIKFQVQASAGALLSTANDLLKFLSANLGFTRSELVPLMEEMQIIRHTGDRRFGSTAMPWLDEGMYQPPGSEILAHGGGGFGYLAFIGFDKKLRRAVVVLSNQMAVNPSGVGWTILQGMPLSRENVTYFVREIVGIGIALDLDKVTGMVRITSVYPKSPAGQAGLTSGLLIQKINGVALEGKSIQECLGLMGGPVGTKVRFEILNAERKETNTVELTRQKFVTTTG